MSGEEQRARAGQGNAAEDSPQQSAAQERLGLTGQAEDASFADSFRPTKLIAHDAEDLKVFSALFQDAVILVKETTWLKAERRFAFVANRYRWEEPQAKERVRTGAHFEGVVSVRARDIDLSAGETPLVVLSVAFEPGPTAPAGAIRISCAGGGDILVEVEAVEAAMADISKPWKAQRAPRHAGGGAL